jgi:HSP20 family protein
MTKNIPQKKDTSYEVQPVEGSAERTRERRVLLPRCDIWEDDGGVTLVADMPGVGQEGLEVTLESNVLTIKGRSEAREMEGWQLRYAEYELADYERAFVLSERVDADKISAVLKNGQLTVSVPKLAPTQRKIPVRAS